MIKIQFIRYDIHMQGACFTYVYSKRKQCCKVTFVRQVKEGEMARTCIAHGGR
jgi:hypothetical protein